MANRPSREATMSKLMRGYSRVASFRRDQHYNVAERLEERSADAADVPFILFEDQSISFSEVDRLANRVAHVATQHHLKRGDVVALLMSNRPEFIVTWLGLAKVGIVTALINTSATGRTLAHAVKQVNAKALIVGSELAKSVRGLEESERPALVFEDTELGDLRQLPDVGIDWTAAVRSAPYDRPPSALREDVVLSDPLYLIFTSGTTGLPKAAKMSHMRFINAGEMVGGLMQFGPQDVFYCVLPLYHGAGGMVVPSVSLAFGRPFVLRRKFSVREFWHDVDRHKITAFDYIGEVCRYLLASPASSADRNHSLRVMTGAGLRADVWAAFVDRFGVVDVLESLGATESNYGLTNVDNIIGSVGRNPYPAHSNIRIAKYDVDRDEYERDQKGQLIWAKAGEVGELIAEALDGTGVAGFFEGYTSPEATEAKLMRNVIQPGDKWVRSGDLVRFDEDDYFYFVDRIGDTYRWKSENISTEEVAAVLSKFEGPRMVNAYGVFVPNNEGRAGMVALTYDNPTAFDPAAFYRFATASLAHYAIPLFVRISSEIAMTSTFKLRKVELQQEGYDPMRCNGDPLFVADPDARTYMPLTDHALKRLEILPFGSNL